jgi:hypothetical protein
LLIEKLKLMQKLLLLLVVCMAFFSCKENETLEFENAKDYFPLSVGKYITYRLDSTNYVGYTTTASISTYYVKDVVDAVVTDNLGRQSFRIVRYYKKLLTDPTWRPEGTIMATPLDKSIEYVDDNNLRFIKLQNPIKEGFSWNANSYIETSSAFSSMQWFGAPTWSNHHYTGIKEPKTYGSLSFPETITVNQADETDGPLVIPPGYVGYSERNYGVEVYAKGVGLVYKDFLHWTYQPPGGSTPGYISGYGVKLTVIDKN